MQKSFLKKQMAPWRQNLDDSISISISIISIVLLVLYIISIIVL